MGSGSVNAVMLVAVGNQESAFANLVRATVWSRIHSR